jgi:hypothetical protein
MNDRSSIARSWSGSGRDRGSGRGEAITGSI